MSQEFLLSVTPVGDDEYLVRTERVAPGVPLAEEQVKWPIEEWLVLARQLMNDPLLGLLQGQGDRVKATNYLSLGTARSPAPNLVALGQQLYSGLFQGNLRDSWTCAQGIAQHRREVLQLRLGLKGKRLPRLPWEVLHAGDRPLATGTDVVFSRYLPGTSLLKQSRTLAPNQPLKILMAIAAPTDQDSLQLKREVLHLQQELQKRPASNLDGNPQTPEIQLTILEQPDREQLTQALEQGQYQVLHYAGHSNLGTRGGELYLVSGRTGLTETLSGEDLAGLLVNNGIQMAVFNSCRGAYGDTTDPTDDSGERNLAEALVKRGIPGVLAMAERIPDEVALILTRLFYRNINQGYPVDLSLSRARAGLISAYGSHQLYWALPILYLHPEFDGYLTSVPSGHRERINEDPGKIKGLSLSITDPETQTLTGSSVNSTQSFGTSRSQRISQPSEPLFRPPADNPESSGGESLDRFNNEEEEESGDTAFVRDLNHPTHYPNSWSASSDAREHPHSGRVVRFGSSRQFSGPSHDSVGPVKAPNHSVAPVGKGVRGRETPMADPQDRVSSRSGKTRTLNPKGRRQPQPISSPQPIDRPLKKSTRTVANPPKVWLSMVLALLPGALLAGIVGSWWWQQQTPKPSDLLPLPDSLVSPARSIERVNLQEARTPDVNAIAIDRFYAGDIASGLEATEELLARGTLPEAKNALDAVPETANSDPEVNFIRGRLAWQFIQIGNKNFSTDDARRYWQEALKRRPDSLKYHNAVGFAYYAEGKWTEAYYTWVQALELIESPGGTSPQSIDIRPPSLSPTAHEEILTAYAGLGLTLTKLSQGLPPKEREMRLEKAIELRQKVMADDPLNFQPDALGKNWMWPEAAIRDWRVLLKKADGS